MHVVTDCMLCGCILQVLHMPALGLLAHVIRYQFEYEKHILQVFYCYTVPDCVGCHEQFIDVTSDIYMTCPADLFNVDCKIYLA